MKLNSDCALAIGRALWLRYGRNWQAVRDAGVERPDGVIDLTGLDQMSPEQERCAYEWSNVNDPPCHPSDPHWTPCPLCAEATKDNTPGFRASPARANLHRLDAIKTQSPVSPE
jgi:hypothetical protein